MDGWIDREMDRWISTGHELVELAGELFFYLFRPPARLIERWISR